MFKSNAYPGRQRSAKRNTVIMVGFGTVRFDQFNPNSEKGRDNGARASTSGLDYSPLPRLSGKSLAMGLLISMGGLM